MRHLAEQTPFDAGTYAYASPLISRIIRLGGIGLEKGDSEAILEQQALAVDFISFHAKQCASLLVRPFVQLVLTITRVLNRW